MSDTRPATADRSPGPALVPHALTDAALTAVAAGRPSAATIETLRRAQLGRHLLLLREIARAEPTAAYAELVTAERADPARVRRLLADPLFGAWAAGCLGALRRGEPADKAGVPYLSTLATTTPGHAEHRLRASHDGLAIDVRLEDADPLRARLGLTPTGRLCAAEIARWQELFAEAWQLLVARHRADAEILATVLEVIVPVEPDPAARGISATSADAFGAVAMSRPADARALAVGLLHETQHSLLNAVTHLFNLHEHPETLGYSPWRDDPRPAAGILHGAYAYLAVTRFWRTEAQADADPGHGPADRRRGGGRLAAFEFARWRAAVATAARDLLAGGGLTPAGTRFVGALLDEVRPWLDEAVASEVVRLAEGANTDHYLRWRLRNLAVNPTDVQVLADRWRLGAPPPRTPVGSRLIPAPRRGLESSARLDLAHTWASGHPTPPPPTRTAPDTWPDGDKTSTRPTSDPGTQPDGIAPDTRPDKAPPSTHKDENLPITQPDKDPADTQPNTNPAGVGPGSDPAGVWLGEDRGGVWQGGDSVGVRPGGDQPGGRASAGDFAYLGGDYGTAVDAYQRMILNGFGDDAAWAGIALVCGWGQVEILAAVHRALGAADVGVTALATWLFAGAPLDTPPTVPTPRKILARGETS